MSARLKSAVMNNVIYYGIYLAIFIVILLYAIFRGVVINRYPLYFVSHEEIGQRTSESYPRLGFQHVGSFSPCWLARIRAC